MMWNIFLLYLTKLKRGWLCLEDNWVWCTGIPLPTTSLILDFFSFQCFYFRDLFFRFPYRCSGEKVKTQENGQKVVVEDREKEDHSWVRNVLAKLTEAWLKPLCPWDSQPCSCLLPVALLCFSPLCLHRSFQKGGKLALNVYIVLCLLSLHSVFSNYFKGLLDSLANFSSP